MIDWFLLLGICAIGAFILARFLHNPQTDPFSFEFLTNMFLGSTIALLLPHAITIEQFNPATDDCTKNATDFIKYPSVAPNGRGYVFPSNCDKMFSEDNNLRGWLCQRECVSWQAKVIPNVTVTPKQDCSPQIGESSKIKINGRVISNEEYLEQFCHDNPSDTERCECVRLSNGLKILPNCEGLSDLKPIADDAVCVEAVPKVT